jgi:hypothetical protein
MVHGPAGVMRAPTTGRLASLAIRFERAEEDASAEKPEFTLFFQIQV